MSEPYKSPEKYDSPPEPTKRGVPVAKLIVLAVVVIAFGVLFWMFGDQLSIKALSRREGELREFQRQYPEMIFAIAFLLYVGVTALSLPGAAAMTLTYGWLFGFWRTVLLVSFASTAGATLAFLLSRYLLGHAIQSRFGDRLAGFNRALEREGAFYLFTLRLIPAVPFFVINVVMGLTPLRVRTFWWVSQLGMLPGTCVYTYAGASVPKLAEIAENGTGSILKPEIIFAFVLLGVFPLLVKKMLRWVRPPREGSQV